MITLTFDELLSYTEEEREKWRAWLQAQPAAVEIRLQPDGRFATVGALIDHIFLVEARHLARLRQQPVPDASGVPSGDVDRLFAYGSDVRGALREYVTSVRPDAASAVREFTVQSGTFRMTPRKLLMHIGLHETRHWAQIALGIRQAGLTPPGNHDLFYSRALE
jgi:uncharacterized damage-inducible protein DinB